ncbi:hypothetical protein QQ045_031309 [Rhodiola kirilowii]
MWRQRSRVEWLKEGDSNTNFFHSRDSQRKKKNTVEKIKGKDDNWITEEAELCGEAVRHFLDVLSSSRMQDQAVLDENLECINQLITPDKAEMLDSPFTAQEVQCAVFQLGATKAPGPDGFSALFFQESWDLVKKEVIDFALRFLNGKGELEHGMNNTLITLIPKTRKPLTFDEFRPISLCNVAMKIITKVLANTLKVVLQDCISVSQSAFVPGRLISDNILIAHELVNYMNTRSNGDVGYCCIKLDMSKTSCTVLGRCLIALSISWEKSMEITLSVCSKLEFVQGGHPKPADLALSVKWKRCNDVIMTWLLNLVSKKVVNHILHAKDVASAWRILHTRYAGSNVSRKFYLKKEICNINQGELDIAKFFEKLNAYWKELDALSKRFGCDEDSECANCREGAKERDEDRVIEFLMGLNEDYTQIRTHILALKDLSSLDVVYDMTLNAESQQKVIKLSSVEALDLYSRQQQQDYDNPRASSDFSLTSLVEPLSFLTFSDSPFFVRSRTISPNP